MLRLPVRTDPDAGPGLPRDRLNALTDGVFAFALTILVLDLRVPTGLAPDELGAALLDLAPRFLGFLLSFGIIGSTWVYVHQMSSIYTRTTLAHLALSILALMFVATFPFATATLGAYPSALWGPLLYAGNALALVSTYTLDFALSRRGVDPAVDRRLLRQFMMLHLGSIATLALGCVLAFVEPRIAVAAVAAHVVGHWSAIWWYEGDMVAAQAAMRRPKRTRRAPARETEAPPLAAE